MAISNLSYDQHQEIILTNQKECLEQKINDISKDLKDVCYWILGLFVLFIPQIIMAISKSCAKAQLKKTTDKMTNLHHSTILSKRSIATYRKKTEIEGKIMQAELKIKLAEKKIDKLKKELTIGDNQQIKADLKNEENNIQVLLNNIKVEKQHLSELEKAHNLIKEQASSVRNY